MPDIRHTVEIPDLIWQWAQRNCGRKSPQTWLRDNILWPAMIADHEPNPPTTEQQPPLQFEPTTEDKWRDIGMGIDPIDSEFTKARNAFVSKYGRGTDEEAIDFFQERMHKQGIRDPRAWLMHWWHSEKPKAI